jgi:tetratricopeptide (TPR) repeat protein
MIYRTRARKELQKALEYCDTAERYLSRVNSPIDLIDTRRHQGAAQTQLGRFDEARQRLEEGIAIAERIGAADRGALVLWEMGALFQKQQQVDKAREYYRLTRQRFVELGATHRVKKLDAILKQLA